MRTSRNISIRVESCKLLQKAPKKQNATMARIRRILSGGNDGAILPLVVIGMMALTITGLAFLNAGVMEHNLVSKEVYKNQAFYLADGGIEHLRFKLCAGKNEPQISWTDLETGDYMVEGVYSEDPQYAISTGRVTVAGKEIVKKIKVIIHKTGVFDHGLFGDDGISLNSNVIVDSYNSDEGSYALTQSNNGDIGTNSIAASAISLDSNVIVYGDATVGPGGDVNEAVSVLGNAEIIGREFVASREKELPVIDASEVPVLPDRGSLYLAGEGTETISQSGRYSSIVIDSNAIVTIDQDVVLYVEDRLEINSVGQIRVTGGADVTIYLGGELYAGSNGIVNESQLPSKLSIVGLDTCTTVTLDSNTQFWGTIYAPNARIEINSNGDLYGSVVGNEIVMDSNAGVHYDEDLINDLSILTNINLGDWQELS